MTDSPFALEVSTVPRRRLGSTSVSTGAIGLGCMGLTGVYDVELRDDRRSARAVQQALDVGIDYFDTADSFGPFGNERFLGEALAGRRDDVLLTTKVGITGRSDGTYHHNATPEHIRTSVDESLRRLRSDHLDVYLLQSPDPAVDPTESWGAMAELVQAGKVRMLGIRSTDTELLARLQRVFPISVVTAELSYAEQGNLPLADWAGGRGIAFVASSPLGRGLLTGGIAANRTFKWTDLRSKLPGFKPDALADRLHALDPLREVARERGVKPGQVALAWLLAQGEHIIAIPGSRDPQHVLANAAAAHLTLGPADLARLAGEPLPDEEPA